MPGQMRFDQGTRSNRGIQGILGTCLSQETFLNAFIGPEGKHYPLHINLTGRQCLGFPYRREIPVMGCSTIGSDIRNVPGPPEDIPPALACRRGFRTTGTYIKATGFNEKAAASVGIHVEAQKIKALVLCGIFCGMGGAYLSMVSLSYFSADMVGGRGFIGIAAEAMGAGIPWLTALFAFLFGVVDSFALGSQAVLGAEYYELLNTLPYLMTLIALIIYAAINKARAAREQRQPTDKSKQTEMTDEKSMAT